MTAGLTLYNYFVCVAGQFRWAVGWASSCASMCFFRFWQPFAWGWPARTAARTRWRAAWACLWCWWPQSRCARQRACWWPPWLGLRLRAILLLPIGGLFAYADPESQEGASQGGGQFALALAGPLANVATGLLLAAAFLGASGNVKLVSQPWISSAWLVRSMVWMQVGLGLLHLLPAYPLDGGRLLRSTLARNRGFAPASRIAAGLGQALALGAMVSGLFLRDYWLSIAGLFVMFGAQIEDQGVFFSVGGGYGAHARGDAHRLRHSLAL
jgi:Zn-dependent protease